MQGLSYINVLAAMVTPDIAKFAVEMARLVWQTEYLGQLLP